MKLLTRHNIDRGLFVYGTAVSLLLTLGALANLDRPTNLISFLLFLPVSLYFLGALLLGANRLGHWLVNLGQPKANPYFDGFTLATFFDQTEISFLATLVLTALVFALTMFRLSLKTLQ